MSMQSIAVDLQRKASPRSPYKASPRSTDSSPRGSYASNGPPEFDTENMNSEDIYDSLRRTTAEIQSFTYSSRDDLDAFMKEGHRVDSDEVSADSGITSSMTDVRVDSPQGKVKAYPEFSPARNGSVFIHAYQQQQQQQSIAKTPPATTPSPSSVTHNSYNPSIYQDNVSTPLAFFFISVVRFILFAVLFYSFFFFFLYPEEGTAFYVSFCCPVFHKFI